MAEWIVARVLANHERVVGERLCSRGLESYWPRFRERIVDKRTHRRRTIARPLYPCYLFVRSRQFYRLLGVEGITGVVMGAGGQATSNRLDDIVEKLRSSESSGFIPAPRVIPKLATGGRVVILSGVLSGHIGMCGEVRGERVKVSTSLFGGEASSWYSEQDLAAA